MTGLPNQPQHLWAAGAKHPTFLYPSSQVFPQQKGAYKFFQQKPALLEAISCIGGATVAGIASQLVCGGGGCTGTGSF